MIIRSAVPGGVAVSLVCEGGGGAMWSHSLSWAPTAPPAAGKDPKGCLLWPFLSLELLEDSLARVGWSRPLGLPDPGHIILRTVLLSALFWGLIP